MASDSTGLYLRTVNTPSFSLCGSLNYSISGPNSKTVWLNSACAFVSKFLPTSRSLQPHQCLALTGLGARTFRPSPARYFLASLVKTWYISTRGISSSCHSSMFNSGPDVTRSNRLQNTHIVRFCIVLSRAIDSLSLRSIRRDEITLFVSFPTFFLT